MARAAKPRTKPAGAARAAATKSASSTTAKEPEASAKPLDKDGLLALYRQMLLIRRFEERAGQLYGMGLIGGFCHLYIGQEAVAVGVQSIKQGGDQIITGYRDHGHMLAAGVDPKAVMAELTGRARRRLEGQGRLDAHVLARASVLRRPRHRRRLGQPRHRPGARQPLPRQQGGGLRLLRRRRGQPGPGLRELQHGRALGLPAVYIIENNQYAMGTSIERSSSETHLYRRGASFNIPGKEVDGMDVLAVREAAAEAAEHASAGKGPFILEMKTYRYRGHSMSDPGKYRTREEIDEVRKHRDPIDHVEELLRSKKMADDAALKAIDAEVRRVVADAAEFARTAPEPDPAELYTDVYAESAAA